jgi:hypothetical protein
MSRRLAVAAAGAAVALAALPGAALAADRNDDHLPDRWERHHGLSLHHKQGHRDQDHDGLRNRAEYRHHTSPRDADSDDDGMKDGVEAKLGYDPRDRDSDDDGIRDDREGAGTVKTFDGTTLTIALGTGGELTAEVTADTRITCESEHRASLSGHGGGDDPGGSDDSSGPGPGGGHGSDDREGSDDASGDDHGGSGGGHGSDDRGGADDSSGSGPGGGHGSDDPAGDDRGGSRGGHAACGAGALETGVVVEHAEVHASGGHAVFEELELRP